jgi:vitamin-K-epoxide reductase (warfarin-sensitive)
VHAAVTDSTASTPVDKPFLARNRIFFLSIAILSLAGVLVSAISLERHFASSESGFCDFNQKFNCDIVNRSEYSSIAGIPVASIGVFGYAALFVFATLWRSRRGTLNWLLAAALIGLGFALYLTYIEAYVLETFCILCMTSLALILLIAALALAVKIRRNRA